MKDNIKPFDVSILSSYMGKWLTAMVALFVIAVTLSALRSGHAERNIVGICVTTEAVDEAVFEPLRNVIAGETRRATTVTRCDAPARSAWDLYVMTTADFFRYEDDLDLEALYEITPTDAVDRAIIVSKPGDDDLSSISVDDVAFVGPGSVNGFLVQLSILEAEGFTVPATARGFRFEGGGGFAVRLVLGVLNGDSRFGACRQSDISALVSNGVIEPGEFAVVRRGRALPENVIASHRSEAAYYRQKLRSVSEKLERAGDDERFASGGCPTAPLLRAYGISWLRPVDGGRMNEARQLHQRFGRFFRSAAEEPLDREDG